MNYHIGENEITVKTLFGNQQYHASEIESLRSQNGELLVTLWKEGKKAVKLKPYREGDQDYALEKLVCANQLNYENIESGVSRMYSLDETEIMIDALMKGYKEYGERMIQKRLGSEYTLEMKRHKEPAYQSLTYWINKNGVHADLKYEDQDENGMGIIDEENLCWLVKNDPVTGERLYHVVTELNGEESPAFDFDAEEEIEMIEIKGWKSYLKYVLGRFLKEQENII